MYYSSCCVTSSCYCTTVAVSYYTWVVIDSTQNGLTWFNRDDRGLEGPEYDFDTKTAKWSVVARWSAGFSDWRGVYGSKGDNS